MARYQYAGPGPIEALSGGDVIRPGDIREFSEEPSWGPWECLDPVPEPEPEKPAAPAAPPVPLITPKGM